MILLFSCKKDEPTPEEEPVPTFRSVVNTGGGFEDPIISEQATIETNDSLIDGEQWTCTTTTYSVMDAGGGNSGFPLFNPNASVIYPGSLLQGASLDQATPDIISVDRAGGTVSYDINDGNLTSFFTVEEVSKSSIGDAMNQIIAGATGIVPANFVFNYTNVQSHQELSLELGIDFDGAFVEVESDFSFSSEYNYNRTLVKLNQSFYTMSFDIPTNLGDLFAPTVTPEDLGFYVGPGNPATYISDVTYGRIYYMLIESTSSSQDMSASISASFNGVVNEVDAEIDASYLSELENLKIQVMAFGGTSASTLMTIGETNLNDLVDLLAVSAEIESGKPVSYVCRSVYNNQIVATQLATEYDVVECEVFTGNNTVPYFTEHWAGLSSTEFGGVGAVRDMGNESFVLFNTEGTEYMISQDQELLGPFPIDIYGGEACPLDDVGAIDTYFNENKQILINTAGTHYCFLLDNTNLYSSVYQTADLGGSAPFAITGLGATMMENYNNQYFFEADPGTRHSIMNESNGYWNPAQQNYTIGTYSDLPFDVVGAACGFWLANDFYQLFFNEDGTQYILRNSDENDPNYEWFGPFNI